MRSMILATAAVMALATAVAQQTKKAPKPDVGNGRVAWFDITTTKMATSKEFYSKLFGWTFNAFPGMDLAAEIVCEGKSIGTLRVAEGKISLFDGVVYIQVSDITASCKKATELGATIPPGFPFNLDDGGGAVALFNDPAGHPLGMYSRTSLPAAPAGK